MNIDIEIREIIQQIGGIFVKKGIPAIPINLTYIPDNIPAELQYQILEQLISEFAELLNMYTKEKNRIHFYNRYLGHFQQLLSENSDGAILFHQIKRANNG